jgi:TonB-linked SusC/RagA family outer membrane protein
MKKSILLIVLSVFISGFTLLAQTKVITGTISSAVAGEGPIPGVTVMCKGTTIGALSDADGKYSITVPTSATTLIFSYVGMKSKEVEIGGRSVIDASLESDLVGLNEVVVTALGISREKKALGYSVQDLGGEKIEKAKVSNIVNAFQGKLSGVQITNSDGGVASGVRILIRGVNSLSANGNNQPLFIVDGVPINNSTTDAGAYGGRDYGNASSDINPSDVENISVLKGASAAALYGSRAVNGVILITTKSGKGTKGLGVTLEENMMWENPLVIPKYQNLYGQGSSDGPGLGQYSFSYVDGAYGGVNDGVDESWGPRLDGRLIPQFDSPYDPETGVRTPTPWIAHPNNIKSFFETGLKRTTNVAISGSKKGADFRLAFSNMKIKGILPNTDLQKNNVTFNGNLQVNDKLTFGASAQYISNKSDNIAENGYNGGNPMQSLGQWYGRQVDMAVLKARYKELNPLTGTPFNWNSSYHNNPYWNLYNNTNSRNRDRLIGNVNMEWKLTDWLKFRAMAGQDFYIEDIMERVAQGDVGIGYPKGYFTAYSNRRQEITANARLEAFKKFGDISIAASLGTEYNHYNMMYHSTTVAELIIPNLYSVSNAAVPATTDMTERHTELQSVFATANIGYKFIFLDLTGRNDWSSTLPVNNNSYFYPSASLSFIVTDALGIKSDVLSLLKLRASYAEVGGTADAYQLNGVYTADQPFNGSPALYYTNTIPPLDLKPQRQRSKEVGMELRLLNNRISFDGGLYRANTINQIMNINVSNTTGFANKTINAGNMQNQGIELQLNVTPVQTKDFQWDIAFNWSKNQIKVVELYKDMKYMNLYNLSWGGYVYAFPGKEYGTIFGYAIVREHATPVYYDEAKTQLAYYTYSGRPIVSTSGRYIRSGQRTPLGNVYPDWFGGITNTFNYKNFNLNVLVDFRKGGDIFSVTHMFGMYTGVLAPTAATNANGVNIREALDANGGKLISNAVYGKVNTDGTVQLIDAGGSNVTAPVVNTTYTDANLWGYGYYGKTELSVFDGSFAKLREVSLGYTFDNMKLLKKAGLKDVTLSVVGRNLWLMYTNMPDIDPEISQSAGNTSVGAETNAIPSTRSYGFNLKFSF